MSKLFDEHLLHEMVEDDDHDLMFSHEANQIGEIIDMMMESSSPNENIDELFPRVGRFNENNADYEMREIMAYHESLSLKEGDA